jgi:hypothetical protein
LGLETSPKDQTVFFGDCVSYICIVVTKQLTGGKIFAHGFRGFHSWWLEPLFLGRSWECECVTEELHLMADMKQRAIGRGQGKIYPSRYPQ